VRTGAGLRAQLMYATTGIIVTIVTNLENIGSKNTHTRLTALCPGSPRDASNAGALHVFETYFWSAPALDKFAPAMSSLVLWSSLSCCSHWLWSRDQCVDGNVIFICSRFAPVGTIFVQFWSSPMGAKTRSAPTQTFQRWTRPW